ncbi:hypothetical protein BAMA_10395 [Bacillus manliponensis]|uniref:Uncharacterized protein n=1 Tax=Bacillus manliponensis TaxID=574376 RepID=A0A073K6K8_9BACI|nr:hypothetical protein [Bacillus manliponensis]KEK17888.1 hypothetical protein BAMA_10395 [Bacillus manliponensis]
MHRLEEVYTFLPKAVKREFEKHGIQLDVRVDDFFIEEKDDGTEKYITYYIETITRFFEITYYPNSENCLFNSMTKRAILKIKDHVSEIE